MKMCKNHPDRPALEGTNKCTECFNLYHRTYREVNQIQGGRNKSALITRFKRSHYDFNSIISKYILSI